jgi:hypothetical protein
LITAEELEAHAILFVCNGNGSHPVPKAHPFHGFFDEVVVAIPLEDITEVNLFLRWRGETRAQYKYELRRVPL